MREIKFRAWDGKVMMSWEWLSKLLRAGYFDYLLACGEIEFMQYTGLTDRCGVEIYEGDILRSDAFNNPHDVYSVEWGYGGFCLSGDRESALGRMALRHVVGHAEVIGNIYETEST